MLKEKIFFKRILAIILTAVISITSLPLFVLAEENDSEDFVSTDLSEVTTEEEKALIKFELTDNREEREKEYMLTDGMTASVTFPEAVHYKENGEWKDIDNTITASTEKIDEISGYGIRENGVKYIFSDDTESTELVGASVENSSVSFSLGGEKETTEKDNYSELETGEEAEEQIPENTVSKEAESFEEITEPEETTASETVSVSETSVEETADSVNEKQRSIEIVNTDGSNKAVRETGERKETNTEENAPVTYTLEEAMSAVKNESSVKYVNVTEGVDIRYDILGNDLKEYIILNSEPDTNEFVFYLKLNNLTAENKEDGSIDLVNESGEQVFKIPAPVCCDDAGQTGKIEYETEETEDGIKLTVLIDEDWLNDEERQYPVIADPALTLTKYGSTTDTSITTSYYAFNTGVFYTTTGIFSVGYDSSVNGIMRGFFKVNTLPTLPVNCNPVNARIYVGMGDYQYVGMNEMTVSAKQATGSAWQTDACLGDTLDYTKLSDSLEGHYVYFDVTPAMQDWYSDSSSNYGITLKAESESSFSASNCAKATFVGYNNVNFAPNSQPKFVLFYRNTVGLEDYYTCHTQDIGRAGEGYVRDSDGSLVFVHTDFSNGSEVMPFTIAHVHNSVYSDIQNPVSGIDGINSAKYSQMKTGMGWRLNIQESVISKTLTDINGTSQTYKVYTDGDGTEHYFYLKDGTYVDEDGLGLKITVSGTTDTLSDEKDNKKIFKNGYLQTIKDANENVITLKYTNASGTSAQDPSINYNRISSVTQKNASESTARTIATLQYNSSGYLSGITKTGYSGTYMTFYISSAGGIYQISPRDGSASTYSYGGGGYRISKVYDGESGYGIQYSYSNNRVNKITEIASDNTTGKIIWFNSIGKKITYIRDTGADRLTNTADDILNTYLFDDYGRTRNSYSANGKAESVSWLDVYGTSEATYTSPSTDTPKNNNKITGEAMTGGLATNLTVNPGFERNTAGWTFSGATAASNSTNAHTGSGYAVLSTSSTGATKSVHQTVGAPHAGTYTASVYVKADISDSISGGGVRISMTDSANNISTSEKITESTEDNTEKGYIRISTSIYLSSGGYCTVTVKNTGIVGTVYIDDIQIEPGDGESRVNILENGTFGNGITAWTGASGVNGVNYSQGIPGGATCLQLTAGAGVQAEITNTVNVSSGDFNNTYILSGWGKARSVPFSDDTANGKLEAKFKLTAKINYTTGDPKWVNAEFNPQIRGEWQYVSAAIPTAAGRKISSIVVYAVYANNNGTAYFDNISLIKESVQTYNYDNNDGQITSVKSSDKKDNVSFTYNGADLTSYTSVASGTYTYTQNTTGNTHLVSKVKSEEAEIEMNLAYTANGATSSSILQNSSDANAKKIKSSAAYSSTGDKTVSVYDANGLRTQYEYDTLGRNNKVKRNNIPSETTDTIYNYSTSDRVSLSYISGKISVGYTYTNGRVTAITRGGYTDTGVSVSQVYSFSYDIWGNTTETKAGNSTLSTYTYAPGNGNMVSAVYGNGTSISYTYDKFDRITGVQYNNDNGNRYEYGYNSDGAVSKVIDNSEGTVTYYSYDGIGRVTSERVYTTGGVFISSESYNFNNKSQASEEYTAYSGGEKGKSTYQYNSDGTLKNKYTRYETDDGDNAVSGTNTERFNYTYDHLKRLNGKNLIRNSGISVNRSYTYNDNLANGAYTSNLISGISLTVSGSPGTYAGTSYQYTYDSAGQITGVSENGSPVYAYSYDTLGQLKYVSDIDDNQTYEYIYDTYGNIRERKIYGISGILSDDYPNKDNYITDDDVYTYTNSDYKDRLTSYNNHTITYDSIGNPLSYYNGQSYSFSWTDGRKLSSTSFSGASVSYSYNVDGLRTGKNVSGIRNHRYIYSGGKLAKDTWDNGDKSLTFIYDENGSPYGFVYDNGTTKCTYYYVTNLQGDVTGILDSSGNELARYKYDAWGKVLSVWNGFGNITVESPNSNNLAEMNPLRYRGYYYDNDTRLYYLQSRYYDPAMGRFINLDGFVSTGTGMTGFNMFAYCNNCPVDNSDPSGCRSPEDDPRGSWVMVTKSGRTVIGGKSKKSSSYSGCANCYAYAFKLENDPRTGRPFQKKPQPGEFAGDPLTISELWAEIDTVKETINEKVSKDMKVLNLEYTEVYTPNHVTKPGNWLVALVYDRGHDYHWYRRDDNGTWSHKRGELPIEYWDYSHNPITDPKTCDRGEYDGFLGYYEVGPR